VIVVVVVLAVVGNNDTGTDTDTDTDDSCTIGSTHSCRPFHWQSLPLGKTTTTGGAASEGESLRNRGGDAAVETER